LASVTILLERGDGGIIMWKQFTMHSVREIPKQRLAMLDLMVCGPFQHEGAGAVAVTNTWLYRGQIIDHIQYFMAKQKISRVFCLAI